MASESSLRPFTPDDMEFLYQVYASSREEELSVVPWSDEEKEQFLRMQFHAQHTHYQEHFGDAELDDIVSKVESFVVDEYQRGGVTAKGRDRIREAIHRMRRRGPTPPP